MNFYCRIVCVLIASFIATHALSQDISGWSDKTICRLAKATPDNVEYQAESKSRGLSCGGAVTQESSSVPSQKVESALAGMDIENESIKGIQYESFVDTDTSSNCKNLDKNFSRESLNNCSIVAVLDTKPKFATNRFKNVWQTSSLLVNRVNKDGELEIVGMAENIQVEPGETTNRKGQMQITSLVVNTDQLGSNSVQVIKNPIVELPASSNRQVMVDVNQDGVTELVIAGFLEDGRSHDSSWRDVNYIYNFETEGYTTFGKPLYSHDFVVGDLDDDGYDEFIDISWPGPQGDGVGVCNGKTLKCAYQSQPSSLHTSKTSLSVYPNKKGGILFHNCSKEYLNWCWSEVTYKNGRIRLKLLDTYISSKKPDKEVLVINWSNWTMKRKGWQVPGYKTSERFMFLTESYRSNQFDMDDDGDSDTVSVQTSQHCKKPASQAAYKLTSQCEQVGNIIFFRNDDGKFTVSDTHEIQIDATLFFYNYDINKDGHMDVYGFRDEWSRYDCNSQLKNIFFGNGDGTFRRPSVMEQSKIFGKYGCEIQSYFFDFEGEGYRTFFTHKYSKNFSGSRAVYVGVEKIADPETIREREKAIVDEQAREAVALKKNMAEQQSVEDELAAFEAELAGDVGDSFDDAVAKRKEKVAAEKAKRIAEEKQEQQVLDELVGLEAQIEAAQEQEALENLAELAEENKTSPLFDGRYSFDLFRYHDDEDWQELGNGFVEIKNGELTIDKDNRDLKTGSTDLYGTFSGQINKKGEISASAELDILSGGVDRSETYHLNGQIDEKIWGDSPRESFFRVYMLLVKK